MERSFMQDSERYQQILGIAKPWRVKDVLLKPRPKR
jgi:hypothetical protein